MVQFWKGEWVSGVGIWTNHKVSGVGRSLQNAEVLRTTKLVIESTLEGKSQSSKGSHEPLETSNR